MSNQKVLGIVGESITFATGDLVRSFNRPYGATGVAVRGAALANDGWNLSPRLKRAFKFTASGSVYREDTATFRERGTNTSATYNSMVATNDFIYIGCDVPFRGVYVNIVNANSTASVLSAFYWDGSAWTGLTETDGTASAGATLAIDNAITWTVPIDWSTTLVNGTGPHYWIRMNSDGGTDSATSIAEVIPMPIQPSVSSATGGADTPILVATAAAPERFWFDPEEVGGIEITAANTEVVRVEWLVTQKTSVFFIQ